jgi:hypothetical protein
MDPITRRSATVSTILHALLVGMAFWPRSCGCSHVPMAPPAAVPEAPAAVVAPPQPVVASRLTLAPSAAAEAPLPALDPRGGAGSSLPADLSQLITPVNQGAQDARSTASAGAAEVAPALPTAPAVASDLIAQVRGRAGSGKALARAEAQLATAQEFLHLQVQNQIDRAWRHLLNGVREHRLIVEVRIDRTGQVAARLVNRSGSAEFDRVLGDWLRDTRFQFPPLPPDTTYPFLIVIRR